MTQIAYFDCPTGIAGNMCLGALLDVGVPLALLEESLAQLSLQDEYELQVQTVRHQGQRGTAVQVKVPSLGSQSSAIPHRHLPEIEAMIRRAALPEQVQDWSVRIFQTLAIAEGAVHGIPPAKVHFHEVGATDALVDIVGTCIGLDWLKIERIYCSALPTGGGTVRAAHGLLPVPVPAVLQLATQRQIPLYDNGIKAELVTPTGAAIVAALAEGFGAPPALRLQQVGLGAGSHSLSMPNLLRLWVGTAEDSRVSPSVPGQEPIALLETQLDDLSPQVVGYLYDRLFEAGAVEVFTQAIGMKKSRPGLLLSVLCPPTAIQACEALLFRETTTLGIRRTLQERSVLERHLETLDSPLGTVRVKVAKYGDRIVNVQPEYEDCVQLARQHQQPLKIVQQTILQAWNQQSQISSEF